MTNSPLPLNESERSARAAEFQRDILKRAGGALTEEQVRLMLGHQFITDVRQATAAHRLLAVHVDGVELFPAFQFEGDSVIPGMEAVLERLPNTSPWAILQFFVQGDEGLGDDLPMDLLRRGPGDIERAARFARTLEM